MNTVKFYTLVVAMNWGWPILSQKNIDMGLTIDQDVLLIGNSQKVADDHLTEFTTHSNVDDIHPYLAWWRTQVSFDTKILNRRLILGVGMRFFNFKYIQDSVIPYGYTGLPQYFGQVRVKRGYGLPILKLGYEHKFSDNIGWSNTISFGVASVMDRFKPQYTSYDPAGQIHYDPDNKLYENAWYEFDYASGSYDFELNSEMTYYLFNNRLSLNGGLSYYRFKNFRTVHNGVYFAIGASIIFNK